MKVNSIRELGRQLGVSHTILLRHKAAGRFTGSTDGYDVEKVRAKLAGSVLSPRSESIKEAQRDFSSQPSVQSSKTTASDVYNHARAKLEVHKAEQKEIQTKLLRKELVRFDEVYAFISQMIVRARGALLNIGTERRDELAYENDPMRCQEIIDGAITKALTGLSQYEPADARENY